MEKNAKLNEDLKEERTEKEMTNAGIVEELDIESLNEVTGGALKNTIRTITQDISGDTKSKI